MFSVITAMKKATMLVIVRNQELLMQSISENKLLAMKDEAGSKLNNEENDCMLDTSYGEESTKELTAKV
nr:hypothetical protein [Tanacetum cinerariifolium]